LASAQRGYRRRNGRTPPPAGLVRSDECRRRARRRQHGAVRRGRGRWVAWLLLHSASAETYVSYRQETPTSSAPPARTLGTAVLQHTVADTSSLGRYLWVFGGLSAGLAARNDLWVLDVEGKAWTQRSASGPIPTARRAATMTLSQQSTAYLFGGETASRVRLNDMFSLALGSVGGNPTWTSITYNPSSTSTPSPRSEHSMAGEVALLPVTNSPNGMILFGGVDQSGQALADLYGFAFSTLRWHLLSPTGTAPQKRKGHAACVLLSSVMVLFGGSDPDIPVSYGDVHLLDLRRNLWTQPTATGVSRPVGRDGHSMVAIDETVYVFGGVNAAGEKLDDLWAFNIYSALSGDVQWFQPVEMSSAPTARWGHSAVVSLGSMLVLHGTGASDVLLDDVWTMTSGCSGDMSLTASRGTLSDGDGAYRANLDCRWTISPSQPNSNVMLFITEIELIDDADRVDIHDGSSLTDTKLASYTGSTVPPSVTSSSGTLLVRLVTNAAGESGKGFQAAYRAVCAAGFSWDALSASCVACPAGSYAEIANSPRCKPCPLGTYAATAGRSVCTSCPAGATTVSVGSSLVSDCTCLPGYFGWNNLCLVCPTGADCPGGNLVRALSGWCGGSSDGSAAPSFKHCCAQSSCPGGAQAECDASVPTIEDTSCSVRVISWDTLGSIQFSDGTLPTFIVVLLFLLLLAFVGGVILGVRRVLHKRFFHRSVVPTEEPKEFKLHGAEVQRMQTPAEPFETAPTVLPPGSIWPKSQPLEQPTPAESAEALPTLSDSPESEQIPPPETADSALFKPVMAGHGASVWEPGKDSTQLQEDIMIVDVDDLLLGSRPAPPRAPDPPGTAEDNGTPSMKKEKKKKKKGELEEASEEAASGGEDSADDEEKPRQVKRALWE